MSKFKIRLFRKRTLRRPTLLGWLVIITSLIVLCRISLPFMYNFLAVNKPIKSKTMIIEGWVPTYALKEAVELYKEDGYKRLIVTGVPIVNYEFISPYQNTAQATILALKHYGIKDSIYHANIPTNVFVDRTYHTAVAAKLLFDSNNWPMNFNIFSVGVHARRSRLMFRKAFGNDCEIGIYAPRDRTFLPQYWWKSSKGFRNVSNEFVATLFVTLFFHPEYNSSVDKINTGRYEDRIYYKRRDKYLNFTDPATSRLNKEERDSFSGFNYYDPDINYRVRAGFKVDTSIAVFGMKTNTERTPEYRTYGFIDFTINDTSYRLSAFQNIAFKDHPVYGKELFVPFKDLTNSSTTYVTGRYIDIPIPVSDSIIIDFNMAYNPYCAYYDRWSCPLVPFENHLDISIPVGEMIYKKKEK